MTLNLMTTSRFLIFFLRFASFSERDTYLNYFIQTGGFVDVINEGSDDSLLVKSFPAETEHWFPVQASDI